MSVLGGGAPRLALIMCSLVLVAVAVPSAAAAAPGDVLWTIPSLGAGGLATSPDGSVVFATGSISASNENIDTVALDATTGDMLWDASFDGPDQLSDHARDIAVSPDGSLVFVTGISNKPLIDGYQDLMWSSIAYDAATGAQLWARHFEGSGAAPPYTDDAPWSIGVSPNGNRVYVAGFTRTEEYGDYAVVAYRAATGRRLWARSYRGRPGYDDLAYDMAVAPDGSKVFLVGESYVGDDTAQDFVTVAFNAATGRRMWVKRYAGPGQSYDVAHAVVAGPGVVYVTGSIQTGDGSGEGKIATVAYRASDGRQRWARRYGTPSLGNVGNAITVSPTGTRVYIGGSLGTYASDPDTADMVTLSYGSEGTLKWARVLRPGTDSSYAVEAIGTRAGKVFVAGTTGTAVYSARSGAKLWANMTGADALAVRSDGSAVFVGGSPDFEFIGVTAYTT